MGVRRLDPEEIEQRLAAGRTRAERMAQARQRTPTSPELQQAIDRAEAALRLVISDVESTTPVRERSTILRYDDWIFEDAQDPDHGSSTAVVPTAMRTTTRTTS